MKKAVITSFIVALCLLIIPLISVKKEIPGENSNTVAVSARAEKADKSGVSPTYAETVFRIKTDSEIKNITATEYITGVVAAEMPSTYHTEALKAQCVAAYTFALYRQSARAGEEYDLTDSFKTDQSFLDEAKIKEKWGEAYDEKIKTVREAVNATAGEYLSSGGAPALTLYHALSPGITNSCADVFGGDLPYLVPVESEGDKLSPDYKSVFSFSAGELTEKLSSLGKHTSNDENLLSEINTAKSGYVISLKYGGEKVSGSKIAGLLALPSGTFTVDFSGGAYTFTCLGRGHGVGLSQYGANRMAESGSSYKEILFHYYPGTKLEKK